MNTMTMTSDNDSTQTLDREGMIAELTSVRRLVLDAVESVCEAGEIVAKWTRLGVHTEELAAVSGLPEGVLRQLDKVGRGALDPRMLLDRYPAHQSVMRLPLAVQAEVLDGPVVLVEVKDENSPPEVRRVSVKALTREQGYQVFSSTGVRREDEQVAWIIEQRERARRAKLSGPAPSAGQVVLQPRTDEGPGYILVNGVRLTHAQLEQYAKATR